MDVYNTHAHSFYFTETTTVITYPSSIFYSPPIHFLPSAAARPKRTHFGEACNETTPGASSASTSTAFPPFRRRNSQPPPPPPRWFARGPNCISQPKTPSEAGNRVGNTFFVFVPLLCIHILHFDTKKYNDTPKTCGKKDFKFVASTHSMSKVIFKALHVMSTT